MQTISDLALAKLPMEEPGFSENPWPHLAAAREQHSWLATCAFGYVIHQYDAMRDLLWLDHSLTGAYTDVVDLCAGGFAGRHCRLDLGAPPRLERLRWRHRGLPGPRFPLRDRLALLADEQHWLLTAPLQGAVFR